MKNQLTPEQRLVWDALEWAARHSYTGGKVALQTYAESLGGTCKPIDMGLYADCYEFTK